MDRKWTVEDAWNMYNVVGEDPNISDVDRDMIGDMLANLISRLSADDVAPLAWLEAEPGATRVSLQSEHGMRIHSMQFHIGKNKPVNRPEGNKLFPLYTTPPAHAAKDVEMRNKAFAFDALVAAGYVSTARAAMSLALAENVAPTLAKWELG